MLFSRLILRNNCVRILLSGFLGSITVCVCACVMSICGVYVVVWYVCGTCVCCVCAWYVLCVCKVCGVCAEYIWLCDCAKGMRSVRV